MAQPTIWIQRVCFSSSLGKNKLPLSSCLSGSSGSKLQCPCCLKIHALRSFSFGRLHQEPPASCRMSFSFQFSEKIHLCFRLSLEIWSSKFSFSLSLSLFLCSVCIYTCIFIMCVYKIQMHILKTLPISSHYLFGRSISKTSGCCAIWKQKIH